MEYVKPCNIQTRVVAHLNIKHMWVFKSNKKKIRRFYPSYYINYLILVFDILIAFNMFCSSWTVLGSTSNDVLYNSTLPS